MSKWSAGQVRSNGITLHYHRTGGNKRPFVLAHGLTDNGLCWTRVAQIFEQDYDVIMVDARGHGLSDAPEDGYSSQEHAADLVGLIRALSLEKPHLMGHSMGAWTVATVAANYPNLVGRAIIEDPPWRDNTVNQPALESEEVVQAWLADLMQRKKVSRQEAIAAGQELHPTWHAIEFEPWVESIYQASPNVLKFITQTNTPWQQLISKIVTPMLLVTADVEAGAIVSPEIANRIKSDQPNIQVVHFSDAGHSIHREQFEQFVAAVAAFLKE